MEKIGGFRGSAVTAPKQTANGTGWNVGNKRGQFYGKNIKNEKKEK